METIIAWKSKGLSEEIIMSPFAPHNNFAPKPIWIHNSKISVECKGSCFKQDKATFTHRNMIH